MYIARCILIAAQPARRMSEELLIDQQLLIRQPRLAKRLSAVIITRMQYGLLPAKLASRPLVFAAIVLALLSLAILFAPRSTATRQVPVSTNPENRRTASEKRRRPEFVPGEALVRFKKNRAFEGATYVPVPNNQAAFQALQRLGSAPLATSQEQILVNVERFAGSDLVDGLRIARMAPDDTIKAVAAFQSRDDVLYAEPNYILHGDATPNDPNFGQLYGLNQTHIDAVDAWNTTTGSPNVVVGVIDEGIDVNHPDLQANIWTNPSPGSIAGFGPKVQLSSANYNVGEGDGSATITVTRDPGDLHGFDFIGNSGIIPAEGHATHVAGTIGAVGNNGVGVVGVNWQVSLMSLRFISQATNSGTEADAIRAYNYARQMRDLWVNTGGAQGANIRVLNASYGGGGYSQASADALNAVGQSGILFVAAAGNEASDTDAHPHYPSNYSLPNVISVEATDSIDALAGFSNFGARSVMLGAPGVGILSTTPNNTYNSFSGTSMATPHVTGAAALLCANNPNLSVNQLRALLSFNGDVIPALQGKSLTGRRLNVFKSLQAMSENDTTPPGTPTGFQITSQNGRNVNLSWTASGDDGAAGQASLYDLSFIDQTTNSVIPLTTITPAASGSLQSLSVKIPYRHTAGTINLREFDNVGNEGTPATVNVNVDLLVADPYIPSTTSPAGLSTGGTGLLFNCDDCFKTTNLPFSFSYFGTNYTSIKISSNGNIYFEPPTAPTRPNGDADDVPGSIADLAQFKMIAGMWDDLDLRTSRRADADVYAIQPDANRIIFRWQGVQFGDGVNGGPINFEIELNSNGIIKTRYGSGNTNLFPVVGISGGEPDVYFISTLTSELSPLSLTNAQSAVFTPRSIGSIPPPEPTSSPAQTPAPSPTSVTSSTLATPIAPLAGNVTVAFATSDGAGAQNCNLINGKASSRCDYMTVLGTVSFAAGETSKTISIPIINDLYVEGNETFTVTLSNASGAPLGAQTTATVTIIDNDTVPPTSNPLDVTDFFVRQHYLDFLNREPDPSGFTFWTNNINNCTPQPACTEIQRINTSAAFFLSIEFQDTGYFVERLYKTAYGDAFGSSTLGGAHPLSVPIIRFDEFLPDTQKIGQGVIVNQGNWQQQLEDNKQTFTEEFVQRSRFTTAFPTSMTPAQFVDTLNMNAGNALSQSERDQLVSDLNNGVKTRAQVLRAIAQDPDLHSAEFNRAFVLIEYFGYLRRNPNDLPDSDYTGYDFWLTKLNQFNGNFINADMVKAFLVSGEYRQRFGP
jgi:subtilisin family serine protease